MLKKQNHLLQKKTALHIYNVNNNHNDVMQTTISMLLIEQCFTLRFSGLEPEKKEEKNK